jgi:hypothetical protein
MNWKERYAEREEKAKGWCPFCGDVHDEHLENCTLNKFYLNHHGLRPGEKHQ